jgi:hypothetical protein
MERETCMTQGKKKKKKLKTKPLQDEIQEVVQMLEKGVVATAFEDPLMKELSNSGFHYKPPKPKSRNGK